LDPHFNTVSEVSFVNDEFLMHWSFWRRVISTKLDALDEHIDAGRRPGLINRTQSTATTQ
jgi:hypothetical protein